MFNNGQRFPALVAGRDNREDSRLPFQFKQRRGVSKRVLTLYSVCRKSPLNRFSPSLAWGW